jgi:hypothetical protein
MVPLSHFAPEGILWGVRVLHPLVFGVGGPEI